MLNLRLVHPILNVARRRATSTIVVVAFAVELDDGRVVVTDGTDMISDNADHNQHSAAVDCIDQSHQILSSSEVRINFSKVLREEMSKKNDKEGQNQEWN